MKRVVLLIGDRTSRNASAFIQAYERLGGRLDAVLLITPGRSRWPAIKALLKPLKALRPGEWRNRIVDVVCAATGRQRFSALKSLWDLRKGEFSWDLLPPGIDLIEHARSQNIPVHTTPSLGAEAIARLSGDGPTLFVYHAGGILPDAALDVQGAEFLNAHMGAMPRYRGMNVIEWAVLEGTVPKVSVLVMERGIDNGAVVLEREIHLSDERTISDLRLTGYIAGSIAMAEAVYRYARGEIQPTPQPSGARYCYRMHGALRDRVEAEPGGSKAQ